MTVNEDKIAFCVRYLSNIGVDAGRFDTLLNSVKQKPVVEYALIRQDNTFFSQVAAGLRDLWPPGKKDGKFDWRESVSVLTDRLKFIWMEQEVDEDYTVEDCLQAGRQYLSRFEHESTKYMQLLKYFIFKQKDTGVNKNGIIKKTYESTLLNMLRDKQKEEFAETLLEGEVI